MGLPLYRTDKNNLFMTSRSPISPGILAALGAAILFGTGIPLSKLLLNSINAWLLAGLLYLGSGVGLTLVRLFSRAPAVRLSWKETRWFASAVAAGGVIAPVLLMLGLISMPASGASLLLNAEGLFTALLAWFAFRENLDRRIVLGMLVIVAGAVILSWPGTARFAGIWPALAILGACFAWGVDNNLTRKVSLADAIWITSVKGLVAGVVNLSLALMMGVAFPSWQSAGIALLIGFFAYGVSLTLFVVGLRHLGTARTGAYFSVAPFIGALLAIMMGDPITIPLLVAGILMAIGIWLHLTEHHAHEHEHEALEHMHEHIHDEHHRHQHEFPVEPGFKHNHLHRHEPMVHSHIHFPDAHHRHGH